MGRRLTVDHRSLFGTMTYCDSGISLSKATSQNPKLAKDEIAFKLRVQVPDDAFDHTLPEAVIQLTNDQKLTPELQVLQDYAAEQIADTLADME